MAPVHASGMLAVPGLGVEARYDDNIQNRDHGNGDLAWLITPALSLSRTGAMLAWQASMQRSLLYYSAASVSSTTTDLGGLGANYAPSEHTSARVDCKFRRAHEDSEPSDERTIVFPASYRYGVASGDVIHNLFEASARITAWDYSSSDRLDATNRRFVTNLIPVRGPTTAGLISYRIQEFDLAGKTALTSHAALAGFRRRHFANLATEWGAGVAEVDYGTGGSRVRTAAFFAKVTAGGPGMPGTAELSLEREAATTMTATLRRELPIGSVTARWETRLESEGGYSTHPVFARRASIAFADTLASSTLLSARGSYEWSTPFHATGSRSETYRADLSMSTPIQPWATGTIGYTFVRQSNPDRSIPLDFRRGRFVLSLSTEFR